MTSTGTSRWEGLYTRFRNAKTTASIIAVLLSLYLVGLLIPQKALFTGAEYEAWRTQYPSLSRVVEVLQLNEIYLSPITVFFLALFFVNLVAVIVHRAPLILQRIYLGPRSPRSIDLDLLKRRPRVWTITVPKGGPDLVQEVRRFFKRRFWSFLDTPSPRSLLAVRNRYSPVGFLLFHLSFLLCLVGGLFVMYTRFSGELVLTEGQEFNADMKQFHKITRDPKIFKALPPLAIQVERVQPKYEKDASGKDVGTDLDILLKVKYWDDTRDETAKINEPIKRGPVSILAHDIGVSPLLVVRTSDGKTVDGGYVSLKVLNDNEDSFQFEGLPFTFFIRFYPDHLIEKGRDSSRSQYLRNPVIHARIQDGDTVLHEDNLPLGRTFAFRSLSLSFEDVRYWVNFRIIREYGNVPLFVGFLCGAIGLIMRLVFYQKTLHVAVEYLEQHNRLWIEGWSEYYQHSFHEDMTAMMADLRTALEGAFGSAVAAGGGPR